MSARVAPLLALLVLACEGSALERSCGGNAVELCDPYEYAIVTGATLEPPELPVADFDELAAIRVDLGRCADAPAPHVVLLSAIVPDDMPADGGGAGVSVMSLLTLEDDGSNGDPTAGDGVIDVRVVNPFIATVPPETDITLRFTPRSSSPRPCTGGSFELPYRTGPMRE